MLTKEEIKALIEGVRAGIIRLDSLPRNLYNILFEEYEKSLMRGLNMPEIRKIAPEETLNSYLRMSNNLRNFSAAKTYQMVHSMIKQKAVEDMLSSFKKYYKTWGRVENDLIVKQSMTTRDWFVYDSQKDVMPYLRYVTAQDERVRHAHAALHGIIRKVDDSFWDEFLPANGYNCRCTVEQLDYAKTSTLTSQELSTHRKEIDLKFRNNPAKSGYIFKETGKDKHPYFNIPEQYKKHVEGLVL